MCFHCPGRVLMCRWCVVGSGGGLGVVEGEDAGWWWKQVTIDGVMGCVM